MIYGSEIRHLATLSMAATIYIHIYLSIYVSIYVYIYLCTYLGPDRGHEDVDVDRGAEGGGARGRGGRVREASRGELGGLEGELGDLDGN